MIMLISLSLATALVDIPAVSMPIAHSLKTSDICGIVLYELHILEWPMNWPMHYMVLIKVILNCPQLICSTNL